MPDLTRFGASVSRTIVIRTLRPPPARGRRGPYGETRGHFGAELRVDLVEVLVDPERGEHRLLHHRDLRRPLAE